MESGFFLGANSKNGFYSLYDNLIDLKSARQVYVIKGSPGCGKSSFMRKIRDEFSDKYYVENIFCSSDPASLDGIVIEELGIAFVDGTAPHIVEPKYPIAVEKYINLGDFADSDGLYRCKDEIISITDKYRAGYERVYNFLSVAGAIESELFDVALGCVDIARLKKKAQGILSRELTKKGSGGAVKKRFISAISPDGYITNFNTPLSLSENIYVLEDNFGVGMFLLQALLEGARDEGYGVYAAYSPLTPTRLEHIIIPEAKLSFITSKKAQPYEGAYKRKIRIDAMVDAELLKDKKKKLSFSRKLLGATINEATTALKENKIIHDEIEALYNPHIDFSGIYALADSVIKEIKGRV